MPTQAEQLDREAAVMLYVAGEMTPDQREAFERRLAAEEDLSAEVERLRAAQATVAGVLEDADAQSRLPASEGVVVRRVSRSINQWLLDRAAAPAPVPIRGPLLPWWAYPTAVAASLIVGFLVWSSRQEVGPIEADPQAKQYSQMMVAEEQDKTEWLIQSLDLREEAAVNADLDQILAAGDMGGDELNPFPMLLPEESSQ